MGIERNLKDFIEMAFIWHLFDLQTEVEAEVKNLPPRLQFLSLHRNSPLRFHARETYFPPDAAARNSQAPFLFKCCRVDYNKETNRLEISKGEYVGKVVKRDIEATYSEEEEEDAEDYDDTMVETTDQTDSPGKCNRYVIIEY